MQELGRTNERIVVVDGDVNNSTRTEWFAADFPDRFFNVGITESNLVGVAGGLAGAGKIPFAASFACFLMCNAFDQLRMTVAFPALNVKLVGTHAGISIGEDGPSQMGIEDVVMSYSSSMASPATTSLPQPSVPSPASEFRPHLAPPSLTYCTGEQQRSLTIGSANVVYALKPCLECAVRRRAKPRVVEVQFPQRHQLRQTLRNRPRQIIVLQL